MAMEIASAKQPGSSASASLTVADELARHILDKLRPGDQLSSEAKLAEEFHVSRITVREALKILAGRGLVDIARGRRAIIKQPDGSVYGAFLQSLIKSDPRCLFDLLQVRRSLEIQSVVFASRFASRAGLAAIEASLGAMRDAALAHETGNDPLASEQRFHEADVGFHEAMALAGGNRVLTYLFEGMAAALQEAFAASYRGQRLLGFSMTGIYEAHRLIFVHVSAKEEKEASDAMSALLDNAQENLRAAFGGSGLG